MRPWINKKALSAGAVRNVPPETLVEASTGKRRWQCLLSYVMLQLLHSFDFSQGACPAAWLKLNFESGRACRDSKVAQPRRSLMNPYGLNQCLHAL